MNRGVTRLSNHLKVCCMMSKNPLCVVFWGVEELVEARVPAATRWCCALTATTGCLGALQFPAPQRPVFKGSN